MKIRTPNTHISEESITTFFLKDANVTTVKIADGAVTPAKIDKTGALDTQVLSYDSATDTVIWQDVSQLDNTFEGGIIVGGAQSIFNDDVQINADLEINGDLDVSGALTGDLTGDVDADNVEANPDSYTPSGWAQFGNADVWSGAPLRTSKANGIPFSSGRSRPDNGFAVMDAITLDRDYDFSGDTIDTDIMATNVNFIGTPGGGGRRTSSTWTRLRDIAITGTDGTDCEYDEYNAHFELITYKKESGNNEVTYSVVDASSDRTQIMNTLEVVARQADSSNIDLSGLQLRYVGTEQGYPDSYLTIHKQDTSTSTDMVRFRDDAGTAKTEFKTNTYFEQDVSMSQNLTVNAEITASDDNTHRIGDLQISRNTISLATEDEVEFDADFNVTGTAYFGSGSGTSVSASGEIGTFGSATKIPFGNTIQLDSQTTDPTGITGAIYFNSTSNSFRGYNGTAWVDLDKQGLETNVDIAGTLDVTGVTTLDSTLRVDGETELNEPLKLPVYLTFGALPTSGVTDYAIAIYKPGSAIPRIVHYYNGNWFYMFDSTAPQVTS